MTTQHTQSLIKKFQFQNTGANITDAQLSIMITLNVIASDMHELIGSNNLIKPVVTLSKSLSKPYTSSDYTNIYLAVDENSHLGQIVYQFAHEYCHYIIRSPWPSPRDAWLEEAVCETSSRYWLRKCSFLFPTLKSYFSDYLALVTKTNMIGTPWNQLTNEASPLLSSMRENHELREPQRFIAKNLLTCLSESDLPDFLLLSQFRDNRPFIGNFDLLTANHPNGAFKKLPELLG